MRTLAAELALDTTRARSACSPQPVHACTLGIRHLVHATRPPNPPRLGSAIVWSFFQRSQGRCHSPHGTTRGGPGRCFPLINDVNTRSRTARWEPGQRAREAGCVAVGRAGHRGRTPPRKTAGSTALVRTTGSSIWSGRSRRALPRCSGSTPRGPAPARRPGCWPSAPPSRSHAANMTPRPSRRGGDHPQSVSLHTARQGAPREARGGRHGAGYGQIPRGRRPRRSGV